MPGSLVITAEPWQDSVPLPVVSGLLFMHNFSFFPPSFLCKISIFSATHKSKCLRKQSPKNIKKKKN